MNPVFGSNESSDLSSEDEEREVAKSVSELERMLTAMLSVNNVRRVPNNLRRVSIASENDVVTSPIYNLSDARDMTPFRPCARIAGRPRQTDTVEWVANTTAAVNQQLREINDLSDFLEESPVRGGIARLQQAHQTLKTKIARREAAVLLLKSEESEAVARGTYWRAKSVKEAALSRAWIAKWLEPAPILQPELMDDCDVEVLLCEGREAMAAADVLLNLNMS